MRRIKHQTSSTKHQQNPKSQSSIRILPVIAKLHDPVFEFEG
jgi:hypothetical protein